jgi:hypothetical protein
MRTLRYCGPVDRGLPDGTNAAAGADDEDAHAVIKLQPNPVLYMRNVSRCAAAPPCRAMLCRAQRTAAADARRVGRPP